MEAKILLSHTNNYFIIIKLLSGQTLTAELILFSVIISKISLN